ncbi:hypothetical protein DN748_14280 [Sinomicrobium soli]|nr:hypothetical protein DN748_14280 [Sinomicrobium sp. N-1-3-6]
MELMTVLKRLLIINPNKIIYEKTKVNNGCSASKKSIMEFCIYAFFTDLLDWLLEIGDILSHPLIIELENAKTKLNKS